MAVLTPTAAYFIHADHLNTPRAITDSTNKVIWRWDSDPFGATLANEDPDNNGVKFTYNLRFPGQYFDKETGLHYNYFRDYNPTTWRYVQSDPIGLAGGLNVYSYVENDPVNWIDPEGLATEHKQNKRESNREIHEKGQARKNQDRGGEKGDKNRSDPRKKPDGHKGPWPPRIPGLPALICPLCPYVLDPPPSPSC